MNPAKIAVIAGGILLFGMTVCERLEASSGTSEDTAIRVLGIHNGNMNGAIMSQQLQAIVDSWNTTALSTSEPTTIEILNGGQARDIGEVLIGIGTMETQFERATRVGLGEDIHTGIPTGDTPLVDEWGADVIVAFGFDEGSICGVSTSFWIQENPTFDAETLTGWDRRGKEKAFVAVAAITGGCDSTTKNSTNAAHEFGHVLGGQHFRHLDPGTDRLNADARAHFTYQNGPGFPVPMNVRFSAMAVGADIDQECGRFTPPLYTLVLCRAFKRYSDANFGGSSGSNNANTFNQTARSVANYRTGEGITAPQCSDGMDNDGDGFVDSGGGGDSDCTGPTDMTEVPPNPPPLVSCSGTEIPYNVNGQLDNICKLNEFGSPATFYYVQWYNGCANTDQFEIWVSQPDGAPYQFETYVPFDSALIWVKDFNARIKVKACNLGLGCSPLSTDSFVAVPRC